MKNFKITLFYSLIFLISLTYAMEEDKNNIWRDAPKAQSIVPENQNIIVINNAVAAPNIGITPESVCAAILISSEERNSSVVRQDIDVTSTPFPRPSTILLNPQVQQEESQASGCCSKNKYCCAVGKPRHRDCFSYVPISCGPVTCCVLHAPTTAGCIKENLTCCCLPCYFCCCFACSETIDRIKMRLNNCCDLCMFSGGICCIACNDKD